MKILNRGADRFNQIPHSGYDDELKSGKVGGRDSPFPDPNSVESPSDPNIIFDELSSDIEEVRDLQPEEYPLAFVFPPLHHSALSDSGSRPYLHDVSKQEKSIAEQPLHRPWSRPPPLDYVKPPLLGPLLHHPQINPASSSGPTSGWDHIPSYSHIEGLAGLPRDPIYISSDDDSNHNMEYLDQEVGSNGGIHAEVDLPHIPMGVLGLPLDLTQEDAAFVPNAFTARSPNDSVFNQMIDSGSDSDIYVSDPNDEIPLAVYISDSDGEEDEKDVVMNDGPEGGVPSSVYMPGSDPDRDHDNDNHMGQQGSHIQVSEPSSFVPMHFEGKYTADSFAHFQDEWLE